MCRNPKLTLALVLVASLAVQGCEGGGGLEPADSGEVAIEALATLDFEDAPTLPSEGGIVARGETAGVFAFVDRQVPWEVIIFSQDGTPVEVVGGRGAGPGEYERIQSIALDAERRLWVISQRGTRADVYTPEFELAGTFSLDRTVIAVWPLGEAPLVAVTRGPEGPGLAYLRSDGTLEALEVPFGPNAEPQLIRIASDGLRRYWAAVPYEFRVFEGDAHGNWSELDLEEPDWFAATYTAAVQAEFEGLLDTRGATILALEHEEEGDLLWITAGVPSSEMDASQLREVLESDDPERLRELAPMLIDHVVVGVDLRAHSVVAEGRFNFRAVSERTPWQYEVAADHRSVVIQRPAVAR